MSTQIEAKQRLTAANPDGSIGHDEDHKRAEFVKKVAQTLKALKAEAYQIGGDFRGPGIWAEAKRAAAPFLK